MKSWAYARNCRTRAASYSGVAGYFAHAGKSAGDPSPYGESCRLMLSHLARWGGGFQRQAYQQEWLACFGPARTWVGYADRPTLRTVVRLLSSPLCRTSRWYRERTTISCPLSSASRPWWPATGVVSTPCCRWCCRRSQSRTTIRLPALRSMPVHWRCTTWCSV